MSRLREKMAEHGFESNDDYDFQLRCLLSSPRKGIRCLNIEGDSERRKTAFAHALARALEYPHILYYDFTEQNPPAPEVILPPSRDEEGREEAPIENIDQVVSEACAFSEGEETILILDQLQAADFREHIRIYNFLETSQWAFRDAAYHANGEHLLVFLISEEPLYHSLQRFSFRVWVNRVSHEVVQYRPEEFGLGADAGPMMEALAGLFGQLGTVPTRSEYTHILHDIHTHVRTPDALRHCIYGWTEGVEHGLIYAPKLEGTLKQIMTTIEQYLGVDEVELKSI